MRAGKIFPKKKFLPCRFSLLAFILRCVIIELRYCILRDLRTFVFLTPMVDERDAARKKGRAKPYGVRLSVA